jgi:hypothetical protein
LIFEFKNLFYYTRVINNYYAFSLCPFFAPIRKHSDAPGENKSNEKINVSAKKKTSSEDHS